MRGIRRYGQVRDDLSIVLFKLIVLNVALREGETPKLRRRYDRLRADALKMMDELYAMMSPYAVNIIVVEHSKLQARRILRDRTIATHILLAQKAG